MDKVLIAIALAFSFYYLGKHNVEEDISKSCINHNSFVLGLNNFQCTPPDMAQQRKMQESKPDSKLDGQPKFMASEIPG